MTYTEAMNLIDKIYTQEKSEIYARYSLATRQWLSETFDQYVWSQQLLEECCTFQQVIAKNEKVKDAFIAEIANSIFQQQFLENEKLILSEIMNQSCELERVWINVQVYICTNGMSNSLEAAAIRDMK